MDNLRIFSTFEQTQKSFKGKKNQSKKDRLLSLPRDKNGMVERSLESKPSRSRGEILDKLEKRKVNSSTPKKVKGQRFGDSFMKEEGSETQGDIAANDPTDPMTSEKLKSMLNTGVVNFSGKEQEILKKILG